MYHVCVCGRGGPSLSHVLWECTGIDHSNIGMSDFELGEEYTAINCTEFWTDFLRTSSEREQFGGFVRRVFRRFYEQINILIAGPPPLRHTNNIHPMGPRRRVHSSWMPQRLHGSPMTRVQRPTVITQWPLRSNDHGNGIHEWDRWEQRERAGSLIAEEWWEVFSNLPTLIIRTVHVTTQLELAQAPQLVEMTDKPF